MLDDADGDTIALDEDCATSDEENMLVEISEEDII